MKKLSPLLCLFILSHVHVAWAGSISITASQNMVFPELGLPGNSPVILSVSPLNSSTAGTATILSGSASRAQFNLSMDGTDNSVSITVDVVDAGIGNPNLTLTNFKGLYRGTSINSFPSSTLPLPASKPASTPLFVGATVTANPGLTAGAYTGSFTLSVLLQ